jgi:hypothetical protein
MRMLGREAIIVRTICHAKSRAFMAIVGRGEAGTSAAEIVGR